MSPNVNVFLHGKRRGVDKGVSLMGMAPGQTDRWVSENQAV